MTMLHQTTPNRSTETQIASAWARLGVMLNVQPSRRTPDIERLLLDTARLAPANFRLFILAAAWLHHFSAYVADHRLARLLQDELDAEARPTLGLLLEWACGKNLRFALDACANSIPKTGRPLSDAEDLMPVLRRQAEQNASPLSRKWGRWIPDDAMPVKHNAIRPVAWVAHHNPTLAVRSTLDDVAASILAEWPYGGLVEGVLEVSRRVGASRLATHRALVVLQLAGRVHVEKRPGLRAATVKINSPV
jgi:hypothetical protein